MLPCESVKENARPQVKPIIKTTLICKATLVYTDYKQLSQSVSKTASITFNEKKVSTVVMKPWRVQSSQPNIADCEHSELVLVKCELNNLFV